ncbi:MAG: NAD(P)/FAD-dependent oxidoreductase [Thermoplasmata archaeon]|nr:MAG: NAD(P)/FAD-dependent oxidoreductase [Thermoplasmata archaeon]MCD6467828.1 NAD(P)/FAD-dependent oxidoreductase [Thermoplasmata archaeon]RLF28223.1 MAG: NAD(P)/FAD-dependent oxidoreductase [Thermoplasmata archaeon]
MRYDVVVVGSGPAGSVTARFAAERGAKVLIVERRSEVGVPVLCAEGISKKVDSYNLVEGTKWKAASMAGARIFSPDRTMVRLSAELAGAETGYVLNREFFDKELARGALKAGAKLLVNTLATGLITDGGRIKGVRIKRFGEEFDVEADIVVGADGVESRVGKWAGINTTLKPHDLETCAQYTLSNVDFEEGYSDFYLGKQIAPGGYVWVFPKGKDVANVGIGVLASLSKPGEAKRLLDEFIASHPDLKDGEPLRFLAGAVPVAKPIEATRDNLVLVGDAARQVDPITGGGLMASIEAGKVAGETIGKAVELQRFDKELLSEYEERLRQTLYRKFERNYVVKETMLGFDDKTLNMLADSLKDYNFEELSTLSLIKALVSKHPSLLPKLKPLLKAR